MAEIKMHGASIDLDADRSVFLGRKDGKCLVRFLNKGERTCLLISDEAMDALVRLATTDDLQATHYWGVGIPFDDASRDCAIAEPPSGDGVNYTGCKWRGEVQ